MSQDSATASLHPNGMDTATLAREQATAPAARSGRRMYDYLSSSSVGLELGISVIIGVLFGYWLDRKLGSEPWMMLLFLVFGFIAGMRGVLRAVRRADRAVAREVREIEQEAATAAAREAARG